MNHAKLKIPGALLAAALLICTAAPVAAQDMPKAFRIATNPQGSLYYAAGSALAKVLSTEMPVPVRVQPYAGTSVAMPLVNSGEVQMGLNNTNDVRMAYRGMKPFIPSPNLRLITVLFPLRVAFFVPVDSDIKSIADLRGKRIPSEYRAQLAVWYNVTSILAGAGMGWDDVKGVPVPNVVAGTQALIEKRVDAALFAIGAAKVREANAAISGGIRFLPIDTSPDGIGRMQKAMPGTYPLKLKKGASVGVLEDITVEGYDVFIASNTTVSDNAAAALVKALHKSEGALKKAFPPFRGFSTKRMVKPNVTVPYHPGAIAAYKELGLWNADMDAVQTKLLSEAAR